MKKLWLLVLLGVLMAFALEPIEAKPKGRAAKIKIRDWPVDVHAAPAQIKFMTGKAPQFEPIDFQKMKENLQPNHAKKIETISPRMIGRIITIPNVRAEILASYKAMLLKHLAEAELREMVKKGATEKEIEQFKMQTDERILNTRFEIMKAFGKPEAIKETERAIRKFNFYKKQKEER